MSADGDKRPPVIAVDVGGTFTDVVLLADGELTTTKVPTTADQSEGVMQGLTRACSVAEVAPERIEGFSHAMTVSVNALLEEAGATTALVTTDGFGDVLEIGRQDRPELYDLAAEKSTPLVPSERRFELAERSTVEGIERPVDEGEVETLAAELADSGIESVAVCCWHAIRSERSRSTTRSRGRSLRSLPS